MTPRTPVATAFDAIAAEYDAVFTNSVIGRAQRDAVWQVIDRVFLPGQHILEINCGTGADAVHLAGRGVRVHACDASAGMVDVARARVRQAGFDVDVELRAIEQLGGLGGPYDGVLSNFGGLNCVEDANRLVCDLERLVRVGGSVLLCYMGPFCAWETLNYLVRGEARKAVRRWKRKNVPARVGQGAFLIHYPTVSDLRFAFAPEFRLREWQGIGVLVPPSYLEPFATAHPRAMAWASRFDQRTRSWPLLRSVADHVLLRFERTGA